MVYQNSIYYIYIIIKSVPIYVEFFECLQPKLANNLHSVNLSDVLQWNMVIYVNAGLPCYKWVMHSWKKAFNPFTAVEKIALPHQK